LDRNSTKAGNATGPAIGVAVCPFATDPGCRNEAYCAVTIDVHTTSVDIIAAHVKDIFGVVARGIRVNASAKFIVSLNDVSVGD
jgi:hypothetical protein